MNARSLLLLCALLLPVLAAHAAPNNTPTLYARLALPPDGSRVIPMMLKSSGLPQTYDVVYLDTNGNGKFESSEKHVAPRIEAESRPDFRLYRMQLLVPARRAGLAECRLSYACAVGTKFSEQCYSMTFTLQRGQTKQTYECGTALHGAPAGQKQPLYGPAGKLTLTVEAKADESKPGQTGFAVLVGWQNAFLDCLDPAPTATLVVRDAAGKIVHQTTKPLSDLGFG